MVKQVKIISLVSTYGNILYSHDPLLPESNGFHSILIICIT